MRISLDDAVDRLLRGEVVAVPTETVYGLAAPLGNPQSIAHIFTLKRRPLDNPLIIHLADPTDIEIYATNLPPYVRALTDAFWPGPLTLVVPVDPGTVPAAARASLPTAAFRIPNHALARAVVRRAGALVAPSANLSGSPSATTPEHVEHDFGVDFPVLDGGKCIFGVESTILVYREDHWQIARLGAIPVSAFENIVGYIPMVIEHPPEEAMICPGQRYRHYAPQAALTLGLGPYTGSPGVVLGFSDRVYPGATKVIELGSSADPEEVCRRLYSALRTLDDNQVTSAWVDMQFPQTGLWQTFAERLHRATNELE